MRAALIVGALGLFGTSVHAAPGSPSVPSPSAHQQPKTSQDLLVQAEGLVSQIASQLNDNRALQSQARVGRDTLRLGCVESQLAVSRALVEASEGTITSIRATVRSGHDVEAAYQVLVTLADESAATHHAAAACLGSKDLAMRVATPLPVPLVVPARGGAETTSRLGVKPVVPIVVSLGVRTPPASP